MLRNKYRGIFALGLVLGSALIASAVLIVDTGDPGQVQEGFTVSGIQWLAGEITLGQDYTITGIEGWMFEVDSGDMTIALYSDGGNVPGTELFSSTFLADGPDIDPTFHSIWLGIHGLSWDVAAGTYWVAFEVRDPSEAWFAMPSGVPSPLDAYAFTLGGTWTPLPDDFGVRVYAGTDVVPEPATVGLLGMALVGLAGRQHRKRKR